MPNFGPGVFKVGETATAVDASCLVNNLTITAEADAGTPVTKLCGTVKPGARTYSWTLEGELSTDPEDPDGLFMLSQTDYGTEVPFTFTPNSAEGLTATGKVILDPMDFGSPDGYGEELKSSISWALVDKPTYAPVVAPGGAQDELAGQPVTVTE